jgi:transposase
MLLAGMRENDVATETGLSRFVVYRLNKKIKSDGIAAAESED